MPTVVKAVYAARYIDTQGVHHVLSVDQDSLGRTTLTTNVYTYGQPRDRQRRTVTAEQARAAAMAHRDLATARRYRFTDGGKHPLEAIALVLPPDLKGIVTPIGWRFP